MFSGNLAPYLLFLLFQYSLGIMQAPLQACFGWNLEQAGDWDVLGPFPIQAREQHFLSPAFPLNLSEPINWNKSWPSWYADGGLVTWSKTKPNERGELLISFPEVRWKYLRAFEGWAALQHHAILRTTFKVKKDIPGDALNPPQLLVHLKQGSYFTILPADSFEDVTPKWYAGDIYALERALPRVVDLPKSTSGEYQLFVAGDYEIRLFGDPEVQGLDAPTQNIQVELSLEAHTGPYILEPRLNVVPSFVSGYAFGEAIGIGLRATLNWLTVERATLAMISNALEISLLRETRIAPSQSRVVPLLVKQKGPWTGDKLDIELKYKLESGKTSTVKVTLVVGQLDQWSETSTREPLLGSFFFAESVPSFFSALPPSLPQGNVFHPPLVALHGAGVDVIETKFWAEAMPPNEHHWILMPTGRTSWGLDWHGPSTQDMWESLAALSKVLQTNDAWKNQTFPPETRVILLGHSNGGQGAWHIAARFPDRVIAAIPAAAYSKSQSYIPLTHTRSSHFIDPALRSILECSLTPDDNDLHASNLVHMPVLAVHGGADDNVPSWHSRVLVNTVQTLHPNSSIHLKEDPGRLHFYGGVVNNEEVQTFIAEHQQDPPHPGFSNSFTLTVSNPSESGSLQGFRIHGLVIPGRLGKLTVELSDDYSTWVVSPSNVESFSISPISVSSLRRVASLTVGGVAFNLSGNEDSPIYMVKEKGKWKTTNAPKPVVPTRIQTILTSPRPLTFVYTNEHALSLATRLVQDLQTYHRLDADIISESEALDRWLRKEWTSGNVVVIGQPLSKFVRAVLGEEQTSFHINQGYMFFDEEWLSGVNQGYMFLHPPLSQRTGNVLFMLANDQRSLERLGKLFPIRTGIPVPDWIVTGSAMDLQGAAGVEGAGLWNSQWKHNKVSSWFP